MYIDMYRNRDIEATETERLRDRGIDVDKN